MKTKTDLFELRKLLHIYETPSNFNELLLEGVDWDNFPAKYTHAERIKIVVALDEVHSDPINKYLANKKQSFEGWNWEDYEGTLKDMWNRYLLSFGSLGEAVRTKDKARIEFAKLVVFIEGGKNS